MQQKIHTFQTPLGWMALLAEGCVLDRCVFGYKTRGAAMHAAMPCNRSPGPVSILSDPARIESTEKQNTDFYLRGLAARLIRFASGEDQNFSDIELNINGLPSFSQRVLAACRKIRWGCTATYGELARRSGSPGAARAVGNVLARNRFPIIVPCHRVLAAGGRLGGFSAPQGTAMKERLLAMERAP